MGELQSELEIVVLTSILTSSPVLCLFARRLSVSLVFYLGCAVELFLEKKTTEAMALGLQMGFTMR